MRFIHTADWHLGRVLHAVSLLDDQRYVLDQLVDLAKEARVDAVVIAGDIYDRAAPNADAVALLDDVLSRLVKGLGARVIAIAGNHDNPDRIGYGARIFADQRLHMAGSIARSLQPIPVENGNAVFWFNAIPYSGPLAARIALGDDTIQDHEAALRESIRAMAMPNQGAGPKVLVAHAFVAGGNESESERPLTVGGTASVGKGLFAGFDYVALGHLHQPQSIDSNIHYAGSLLKYSSSEIGHTKSFKLVEMDRSGIARVEAIPIRPRRDVRRIEGLLDDVVRAGFADPLRDDYVIVKLMDEGALLNPMLRLQQAYPNAIAIEYAPPRALPPDLQTRDRTRLNPADLFPEFYKFVTGDDMNAEQTKVVVSVADESNEIEEQQ
ncbi:MAG: exonuclease SbcCD subunit D [Acidobacteriota bacterium]